MPQNPTRLVRFRVRALVLLVVLLATSCGASPSSPSKANPTVVISATGVSPTVLRVEAWSQVRFVHNDTRPHTIASDPVDRHTDCPPINSVGLLLPGERRDTRTLNLPGTCGYHDHNDHTATAFHGRLVVE